MMTNVYVILSVIYRVLLSPLLVKWKFIFDASARLYYHSGVTAGKRIKKSVNRGIAVKLGKFGRIGRNDLLVLSNCQRVVRGMRIGTLIKD